MRKKIAGRRTEFGRVASHGAAGIGAVLRESEGGFPTHFEGKQIKVADGPDDASKGRTYLAALDEFRRLMQVSNAGTADQDNTVRVVVDMYGQHLEPNGQARSLEILLALPARW